MSYIDKISLGGETYDIQDGKIHDAFIDLQSDTYHFDAMGADATSNGWRLNESDGLCSSNSDYKLVKFKVTAGDYVKIVSTDRAQFQTVASVPSSGSSNRVGDTYGAGTFSLKVPDTATYLIMSALTADTPEAYKGYSILEDADAFLHGDPVVIVEDNYYDSYSQRVVSSETYNYVKVNVTMFRGATMSGRTGVVPNDPAKGISFTDFDDRLIENHYSTNTGSYDYTYSFPVPANADFVYIPIMKASAALFTPPKFGYNKAWGALEGLFVNVHDIGESVDDLKDKVNDDVYTEAGQNWEV